SMRMARCCYAHWRLNLAFPCAGTRSMPEITVDIRALVPRQKPVGASALGGAGKSPRTRAGIPPARQALENLRSRALSYSQKLVARMRVRLRAPWPPTSRLFLSSGAGRRKRLRMTEEARVQGHPWRKRRRRRRRRRRSLTCSRVEGPRAARGQAPASARRARQWSAAHRALPSGVLQRPGPQRGRP
ncbi:unnamed protein product, partial [Prorocentrum cordatum]